MKTSKPHVVVGIELDETARPALATASRLAGPNGRITVLYVVAGPAQVRKDAASAARAMTAAEPRVRVVLERELGRAPKVEKVDLQIGVGEAAQQIVQLAVEVEADFIVVGTHDRHGLERFAYRSVASEVMQRAPCTVVVARVPHYEDMPKPPHVDPPLAPGQRPMRGWEPVTSARGRFAFHDANVIPTGIDPRAVR
jgi:universal stress protein A